MKITIPLAGGKLSQHFGHCDQFAKGELEATGGDCGHTHTEGCNET